MRLSDLQRRVQTKEGLLNLFPNAYAAYSLRSLDKFINAVVRVRRSSDNAEQDFSENGILSGLLTQFVGVGNNGFVRILYDQSGNGNHAIQTSLTNQPLIVQNGALILVNGKPAINFDGIGVGLISVLNILQPYTAFTVSRTVTPGSSVYDGPISLPQRSFVRVFSNILIACWAGTFLNSNNGVPSNRKITYSLFNSSNSEVSFNETLIASGNAGTLGLNRIEIGAPARSVNRMIGEIQEIIIYPNNQSSNKNGIFENINQHYAIF